MNAEYYRDIDDPEGLVPDERDPETGRRIPARRSKQHDDARSLPTAAKRPAWAIAAVIVVVLVLLGGTAVALTSRRGSDEDAAATGSSTVPAGGTTSPGPGGGAGTSVPAGPLTVNYEGGKVVESVNSSTLGETLTLFCDKGTCSPSLPNLKGSAATGWTGEQKSDMGEICISNGVAAGRETNTMTWKVTPVGTTTIRGVEVPARLTGTFSSITPGVPNCLQEARLVYQYDAVPTGN